MSRPGQTPFVSSQLFRAMAAERSRRFFRVDASLLIKYAAYFFVPRPMYSIALRKRHTTLISHFARKLIRIFRGRAWRGLTPSRYHTGFKAGAFAKTRVLAIFRQKATRKKKPSATSATANLAAEAQIARIRQMKAGQRKRSVGKFNPGFDAQFAAVS